MSSLARTLIFTLFSTVLASLARRQENFDGDTQDGLSQECKPVTIIFARGTTESGNVGTLVGPPFFKAVAEKVGADNLAVQGVDYPADVDGFVAGGDAGGSELM